MGRRADDTLAAQREVLFGTVAFQMVLTVEQAGHDGVNGLVGGTAHHSIHLCVSSEEPLYPGQFYDVLVEDSDLYDLYGTVAK